MRYLVINEDNSIDVKYFSPIGINDSPLDFMDDEVGGFCGISDITICGEKYAMIQNNLLEGKPHTMFGEEMFGKVVITLHDWVYDEYFSLTDDMVERIVSAINRPVNNK